ncbi:LysR family transcriptional regulator [Trinickia mobilis]|uniref:LysR family transcriptional regulator n=1 Tax=Trinickia mobilis TaxID=2816356 RepID=UPI001A8C585D|nr:LysR family transcriptional regulator [Trinickia mobilis]
MNLRFLETFLWVARLKSFSLAADKLCATQASVSSRIAALEAELGAKLFVRDTKGVALSAEGARILGHAELVVDTVAALRASLQTDNLAVGKMRVGAMDTVVHTWFVDFISELTSVYPNLEVEVTADTALNLGEQLLKGFLDVAFHTDLLRSESVCSVELARYPMCWIAAQCRAPGLDAFDHLGKQRLVTFSRHSRPHQDVVRLLQQHGIETSGISCVNSVAAMTRLVRNGFGVGVMPPLLVRDLLAQQRLYVLDGLPLPPPMPIVAAWHVGAGIEWPERIVRVAQRVARRYGAEAGP